MENKIYEKIDELMSSRNFKSFLRFGEIYRLEILVSLYFLQIIFLMSGKFLLLPFIILAANIFYNLFFANISKRKTYPAINILTSFYLFVLNILFFFLNKLPNNESFTSLKGILFLFTTILFILSLNSNTIKKIIENINFLNLDIKLGITKEGKYEIEDDGDIVLGFEIDTVNYKESVQRAKAEGRTPELSELKFVKNAKGEKRPIVFKNNDRYVHSLILGPTGSGKTSQIILPMINQDMDNRGCSITVLEPKGDLAEKVWAMAQLKGRNVLYFNPTYPDCPYFNPMAGEERTVMENIVTTFTMLAPTENQFFKTQNEVALRNSIKVCKRLLGDEATLLDLLKILQNPQNKGKEMIQTFSKLPRYSEEVSSENDDLYAWFMDNYYAPKSKTAEFVEGIKGELIKITSNEYLRRVLNPPKGLNQVDFVKHLNSYDVIAMSTAQGELGSLNMYLGYFLILQFQSAVFSRPGDEKSRIPDFLYIDEFQEFANDGFDKMLTQGRSYRVSSNLATQAVALIGKNSGNKAQSFIDTVLTNARTQIVFPGANNDDAKYFSDRSGEKITYEEQVGVTSERFNPLKGLKSLQYDKEQRRKTEKLENKFSISDIIYQPFEVVFISQVLKNTVNVPKMARISWLEKSLNDKIDELATNYRQDQLRKREKMHEEIEKIKEDFSLNSKKGSSQDALKLLKDSRDFEPDAEAKTTAEIARGIYMKDEPDEIDDY